MFARRVLMALAGLVVLVSSPILAADRQQAVSISGGGATELGKATVLGNASLKDFKATVNVSEASSMLSWLQGLHRRQNVEKGPVVIRLENGQKFEFLEPMITDVVVSGSKTVTIEIKHRDGMLRLTVPKKAWELSWPPVKK